MNIPPTCERWLLLAMEILFFLFRRCFYPKGLVSDYIFFSLMRRLEWRAYCSESGLGFEPRTSQLRCKHPHHGSILPPILSYILPPWYISTSSVAAQVFVVFCPCRPRTTSRWNGIWGSKKRIAYFSVPKTDSGGNSLIFNPHHHHCPNHGLSISGPWYLTSHPPCMTRSTI